MHSTYNITSTAVVSCGEYITAGGCNVIVMSWGQFEAQQLLLLQVSQSSPLCLIRRTPSRLRKQDSFKHNIIQLHQMTRHEKAFRLSSS